MNFLGHAALARAGSDAQLLGCLIADGVKGQQALEELSPAVRQGVVHHRLVDSTIDAHPDVQALVQRMPERRFAAIALDIVWDYCLHRLAALAPDEGWFALIQRCHRVIQGAEWLPPSKASLLQNMVKGRWLVRSAERQFMLDTIMGVGRHMRRPQDFTPLCEWVESHLLQLERAFIDIWQDMWRQTNIATGTCVILSR